MEPSTIFSENLHFTPTLSCLLMLCGPRLSSYHHASNLELDPLYPIGVCLT